jgi:hypothetical protein
MAFTGATADIDASRASLESIVGHHVATFAYPHGYHTARLKLYLRTHGFDSACAVKQALSHPTDDRFALARAIVGSDMSMESLDGWIHGQGLPMSWRGERPKTRIWRLARRIKRMTPVRARRAADA